MLTTFSAVRFGSGQGQHMPGLAQQDNPQGGQPVAHPHHQAPNPPVLPPQRRDANLNDLGVQEDVFQARARNVNEGVQDDVIPRGGQARILRNILVRNMARNHANGANPQEPNDQG